MSSSPITAAEEPASLPRVRGSIGNVRNPASTEAILRAAAEILDESGYNAVTFDAVARRAGSSKPTIYRWWRNKGELLRDVYERAGESRLVVPDSGDLETDLRQHLHSLWQWWSTSRSGEALRSFITEIQLRPETIQSFRSDFQARRTRTLTQIFHRAIARGQVQPAARIDAAVALLVGISWVHLLTNDLSSTEPLDAAVRIVAQGLIFEKP